jgi:hypothetical protein
LIKPYLQMKPSAGALALERDDVTESSVPYRTRYQWTDNICSRWPSYGPWL